MYREQNSIIVQQDATVFNLLHFCRHLYMFGVLTHTPSAAGTAVITASGID